MRQICTVGERELGEGWVRRFDHTHQHYYHYNTMTNESRWEPGGARRKSIAALQEQQAAIDAVASSAHPVAAAIASAAVAATACAEGGATATADSQWLRQLDPATGRYYFTHHETGESRWEEAEEAQVPEWERLVDSASGHHYVVNRRTSESKWVVLKSNSVAHTVSVPALKS